MRRTSCGVEWTVCFTRCHEVCGSNARQSSLCVIPWRVSSGPHPWLGGVAVVANTHESVPGEGVTFELVECC